MQFGRSRRREFTMLLGSATAAWPLTARAQQADRTRRVGVLSPPTAHDPEGQARAAVFRSALKELGWTDGRNLQLDIRWSGGDSARRDPRGWQFVDGDIATSNPVDTGRFRNCRRPGRCRLRQQLGTARRQCKCYECRLRCSLVPRIGTAGVCRRSRRRTMPPSGYSCDVMGRCRLSRSRCYSPL